MNSNGRYHRLGLAHYLAILLIVICSLIIIRRNALHETVDSDRGLADHASGIRERIRENHFPRARTRASAVTVSNSDQTLSQCVDKSLAKDPFSANGFSPIAAEKYGFDQNTINLLNSHILQARVSVAKLICSNLIAVKDENNRPNAVQSYEYKANLNEALLIKDDLIKKVNLATGRPLDAEINRMLGGNPAFLFCGSANLKFNILTQEENGSQEYIMEYSCDTIDGTNIFSNYRCNLRSFSNSTLIDFDLPNLPK